MKQEQKVVYVKVLDKAAPFRGRCNPPNTSAFSVVHGAIWIESGAQSPLVEYTHICLSFVKCNMKVHFSSEYQFEKYIVVLV